MTRTLTYQVNDQLGQPIKLANMPVGDVICNNSTNQLNLQGYNTTCGGNTGSCFGTAGPCGKFTDAGSQFPRFSRSALRLASHPALARPRARQLLIKPGP